MRRVPLRLPILALGLLLASACARPLDLDPDLHQTHAVNIVNSMAGPMVVWFDDGSGERLLGTVAAGSSDRFVIAGTDATTITVVARDEGRTQTVRRTVTLVPGETVRVQLD